MSISKLKKGAKKWVKIQQADAKISRRHGGGGQDVDNRSFSNNPPNWWVVFIVIGQRSFIWIYVYPVNDFFSSAVIVNALNSPCLSPMRVKQ